MCEGCGLGIADRYVMRVADGSWHEDCLVCCICHAPLVHSCFTRSGRVYCRQDYDRYPILTSAQRRQFKASFEISPKRCLFYFIFALFGSDLLLDDSGGFDQLDDGHSLSGVDLQDIQQQHPSAHSMSLHHHQHHLDAASPHLHHSELIPPPGSYHPINPIDKLYLMQNAYFRLDQ